MRKACGMWTRDLCASAEQRGMPRVGGATFPGAAADVAESLRRRIEDDRLFVRDVAKLATRNTGDVAVLVAIEHATGIEYLHAEGALEFTHRAEHRVDRTAGGLAVLLRGNDQERTIAQFSPGQHRHAMRRP